jgi:hypothetical protein
VTHHDEGETMSVDDISARKPDPLAERLQQDTEDAVGSLGPTVVGFFAHGPEPGYERIYFASGAYLQFQTQHVLTHADVPADRSPVLGERATAVRLRPDAPVEYVRNKSDDHFDLKLRIHDVPAHALPFPIGDPVIARPHTGSSYWPYCHC